MLNKHNSGDVCINKNLLQLMFKHYCVMWLHSYI